jgi:hypothetical protein
VTSLSCFRKEAQKFVSGRRSCGEVDAFNGQTRKSLLREFVEAQLDYHGIRKIGQTVHIFWFLDVDMLLVEDGVAPPHLVSTFKSQRPQKAWSRAALPTNC